MATFRSYLPALRLGTSNDENLADVGGDQSGGHCFQGTTVLGTAADRAVGLIHEQATACFGLPAAVAVAAVPEESGFEGFTGAVNLLGRNVGAIGAGGDYPGT